MNTIIGSDCSLESMFNIIPGWTSRFEINGKVFGGDIKHGFNRAIRTNNCIHNIFISGNITINRPSY